MVFLVVVMVVVMIVLLMVVVAMWAGQGGGRGGAGGGGGGYRRAVHAGLHHHAGVLAGRCKNCRVHQARPLVLHWVGFHFCLFLFPLHSPVISLGFTILGGILVYMTIFYNPTIQVVTIRLYGWCMLSVFFLPAFTCLGHECHSLLSLCSGMCLCTD